MPEIGGFEATAVIREQEKSSGRHLPIVAMTAHAMKGDRNACLQAGMDGYVSKPVQSSSLLQAIEEALGCAVCPVQQVLTPPPAAVAVFDREDALLRVEGDQWMLRTLIDLSTS